MIVCGVKLDLSVPPATPIFVATGAAAVGAPCVEGSGAAGCVGAPDGADGPPGVDVAEFGTSLRCCSCCAGSDTKKPGVL